MAEGNLENEPNVVTILATSFEIDKVLCDVNLTRNALSWRMKNGSELENKIDFNNLLAVKLGTTDQPAFSVHYVVRNPPYILKHTVAVFHTENKEEAVQWVNTVQELLKLQSKWNKYEENTQGV